MLGVTLGDRVLAARKRIRYRSGKARAMVSKRKGEAAMENREEQVELGEMSPAMCVGAGPRVSYYLRTP